MADSYDVTTVLGREEVLAGTIHRARRGGSFVYAASYLGNRAAFALAPALPLFSGPQALSPTNPFSDSAPDTWGRKVLNRAAGRGLDELSLMLGVNDRSRQGATRFWDRGVAVADGDGTPVEAELADVLRVADQIQRGDKEIAETDVRRLFRATGSLGGARPKANVLIGDELWLAKFPKPTGDDWNVMAWEAAMLDGMDAAGIDVPAHATRSLIVEGETRTILLLRRFDRAEEQIRVPYISAMTALESSDGEGGDWVDLVDFARMNGADPTQLWRRAMFGALVGNLDDHLRNHGFLRRHGVDWALSPAFDVNPRPLGDGDDHELALFGARAVIPDTLLTADALDLFGMSREAARRQLGRFAEVLPRLRRRAEAHGADAPSIEIMRTRIESAVMAAADATSRSADTSR